MALSRREFLFIGGGALAAGTLGTALHEPYEIDITQVQIQLKRLPPALDGLRIAQLSDIHFDSFVPGAHLASVVEQTNAQKPDLVLLTGDFVTMGHNRKARAEQAGPCADLLRKLDAPLGCFAVLGNHDYGTNAAIVARELTANGRIQLLRNQSAAIETNGARLWLAGLDDAARGRPAPQQALQAVPRQECTIVAVHEPDYADAIAHYPVDLQISGHSHGGQVRLPFVGALFLPPGARKYPMGHYRIGDLQLYTNRGIGVIGLPMRFLCPPEVTIFTLRSA